MFAVLPAEHPIRADQCLYYRDPRLRRLVPDPEKTDVLAGLRRQYLLPDPGLGAQVPDREAVEDAIQTQQTEGTYVKSGNVPPKHAPASANGNGHFGRNTAIRGRARTGAGSDQRHSQREARRHGEAVGVPRSWR